MKRILIKADLCDGCKNCSVACMQAHRVDEGTLYDIDLSNPANETRHHIAGRSTKDGMGTSYLPIFCRHCDEPECVMSCMSGALVKEPLSGHVQYDETKCAACFMCVMNCPFGVLKPDTLSRMKIIRCDFCKDAGGEPNCVQSCPKKAIYVEEVES